MPQDFCLSLCVRRSRQLSEKPERQRGQRRVRKQKRAGAGLLIEGASAFHCWRTLWTSPVLPSTIVVLASLVPLPGFHPVTAWVTSISRRIHKTFLRHLPAVSPANCTCPRHLLSQRRSLQHSGKRPYGDIPSSKKLFPVCSG